MQLKVVLPSGEVNVPVEPNSTPGHLKENLKYSLRVPPKLIRLTIDGRELDDIKPLNAEPNNVTDGSTLVAEPRDGVPEEDTSAPSKPVERAPVMIKKEEPPKPKKIKKDVVRPVVAEGDVVKVKTISPGSQAWAPTAECIDGKSSKRHLAFMRLEVGGGAVAASLEPNGHVRVVGLKAKPELNGMDGTLVAFDESKGRWATRLSSGKMLEVKPDNLEPIAAGATIYPQQEEGGVVIALGDPHTSPAWTEVAKQLDVGERAEFKIARKIVDFDPEGLNPTDSATTWKVELLKVEDAIDLLEDFSQLLHVENAGGAERAEDLDNVAVHWRVRRWTCEGFPCIASSRERIAIMPGYGLVPIEAQDAPPVTISVGEGQQEAVEAIAQRVGPGGLGHLFLKTEAMKHNRPAGCAVIDVELIALDDNRGPGSSGWRGWQSLVGERDKGDQWLEEAEGRRKQLETFGTLKKSTDDSKGAEAHVAGQVHQFANNAHRRYGRVLKWIEAEGAADAKRKLEKATVQMRYAKALVLKHQRFGEAAESEVEGEEKQALEEAQNQLGEVLANSEALENENLTYECLKMVMQVHIQAQSVDEARKVLDRLTGMRSDDDELRSDGARINRLETALNLKKGASNIEGVQKDLQTAITAVDKPKVTECLETVLGMITGGQVTWDTVRTLKVGKDVGNAMKMGDPDIAAQARKIVQEIQALAQRAGIGL
jgi:hypothetical protein